MELQNNYENKENEIINSIENDDEEEDVYDDEFRKRMKIDFAYERSQEHSLLLAINCIGKDHFKFFSFQDSIEKDTIPNFVDYFENIYLHKTGPMNEIVKYQDAVSVPCSSEIVVTNTNEVANSNEVIVAPPNQFKEAELTEDQIKRIEEVLKRLSLKEKKFDLLRLNFENFDRKECSAILFYSNFLNCFFLKTSKREMYDRCKTLFITKIHDFDFTDYEYYSELTKYDILPRLAYFLAYKNFNFQNCQEDIPTLFEKAQVPLIVDVKFLHSDDEKKDLPDCIFYQLQFLFNVLDSKPESFKIKEFFLIQIRRILSFKLPNYEELKQSIEIKAIAKRLQKRTKKYKEKGNQSTSPQKKSKTNSIQRDPPTLNTFEMRHSNINEENKVSNIDEKEEENLNEEKYKISNSEQKNDTENEDKAIKRSTSFDKFWNKPPDPAYRFENGILIHKDQDEKNKNQKDEWVKNMNEIKSRIKDKQNFTDTQNSEDDMLLALKPVEIKLYKILFYKEEENSWSFNSNSFHNFVKEKFIYNDESPSPFILFLNSNEMDYINILSRMINPKNPDPNEIISQLDDDISIYATYEHPLSQLVFSDFTNISSVKPIFFFLHVPEDKKENITNLSSVIIQVYIFLSTICDFEVIILNKEHYLDQKSSMEFIMKVANSYEVKIKDDFEKLTSSIFRTGLVITPTQYNKIKNNIIYLLTDDEIKYHPQIEKLVHKNNFFRSNTAIKDTKTHLHYINISEYSSYGSFIDNIAELFLENSKSYHFLDIERKFPIIEKWKNCQYFINLMSDTNKWKANLRMSIEKRIEMLKNNYKTNNEMFILSKIGEELNNIAPPFAIPFIKECYRILSEKRHQLTKGNWDIIFNIKKELKESSTSNLECINYEIHQKSFLQSTQIDLIKESHEMFLQEEFFNIIKGLMGQNQCIDIIYEDNIGILNEQIKEDRKQLKTIFTDFNDKIKQKEKIIKKDIQKGIEQGVNYAMREIEHLKEIKIEIVSSDDLHDKIPQDF